MVQGEAVTEAFQKLLSLESLNKLRERLRKVNMERDAIDLRLELPADIFWTWVPTKLPEEHWDTCVRAVIREKLGYAGLCLEAPHIDPGRLLRGCAYLEVNMHAVSLYLEGLLNGKITRVIEFGIEKYETKEALRKCTETLELLLDVRR